MCRCRRVGTPDNGLTEPADVDDGGARRRALEGDIADRYEPVIVIQAAIAVAVERGKAAIIARVIGKLEGADNAVRASLEIDHDILAGWKLLDQVVAEARSREREDIPASFPGQHIVIIAAPQEIVAGTAVQLVVTGLQNVGKLVLTTL